MKKFVIKDGVLIQYNGREDVVTIPNEVKEIGLRVFYRKTFIKKVVLGKNVTHLRDMAFYECTSLASVESSPVLRYVGKGVFEGCKKLKHFDLSTVSIVSENAFFNSGIESADLTKATKIKPYAFKNCRKLKSVKLGEKLRLID